jgi:murein DD-endopeptidase MepM/ murein hydrolase activator NlpD
MLRPRLVVAFAFVFAGEACVPALRPLPPMAVPAPLPEPPAESPMPTPLPDEPAADAYDADLAALRARGLTVPVRGAVLSRIPDTYDAPRDGGRRHEAVDILAPRGTPVLAADDGVILRVGTNQLGGNVIWAADVARHIAYYYAHLERYARGVREGQDVRRGDVIGYVGTTGNAPPDTPHLHFQVIRIVDERHYSSGPPLNPLPYFLAPGMTPGRRRGKSARRFAPKPTA